MADTYPLSNPGSELNPGPDGNKVQFNVSDGTPGKITFCLSSANNITWWKGVKVFGLPPNEDEAINNPKLIEKADYLIQWPDNLGEQQAKKYCNEVLIYIRLSEIYNSIKK